MKNCKFFKDIKRHYKCRLAGSQENTKQLQNHGINPYNYGRILNDFKCFAAGTKVTMGDLTYKNIENIVLGDSVLT